jgi:hypothetical protein
MISKMSSMKKPLRENCAVLIEDYEENAFNDSEIKAVEVTTDGRYQCRCCGKFFITLAARGAIPKIWTGNYNLT